MAPRILNAVAWSVATMVLGAALLGCRETDAPSSSAPAATTPGAAAPAAALEDMAKSAPFGVNGARCRDDEWVNPSHGRNGKDQIVIVDINPPELPKIVSLSPECAKESEDGDMTFRAPALPAGYTLQIEIDFWEDTMTKKRYKSPFKRNGPRSRYPIPGTCFMLDAKDECHFDVHHPDVKNDVKFTYTVYLWDTQDQLADEKDPGIMVIDNP